MLELEIGLVDGSKLIFREFFLQFIFKKKFMPIVTLKENSEFD